MLKYALSMFPFPFHMIIEHIQEFQLHKKIS